MIVQALSEKWANLCGRTVGISSGESEERSQPVPTLPEQAATAESTAGQNPTLACTKNVRGWPR
jgi:hypothetical protein